MRVLVTGAAGMLGRDVCSVLEERGHQVIATTRNGSEGASGAVYIPLEITNTGACTECIDRERPEAIIHCAAWT
ncbi:MAG: NAD-dependent epimerase/dehydratase family protein, partial [Armatimonadota bacterium]